MSDLRDELYSLLVPLAGERLIVPRACVAEVIGYQPLAEMTNAPPWYAGLVNWASTACRSSRSKAPSGSRSERFQPHANRDLPRVERSFARWILRHAHAGLPAVWCGSMRRDPARPARGFSDRSPVICQVRMVNETPLIPDLQRLEQMIAEETSVMTG